MKKKPRRRLKKGKGSPSGLGPNKKGSSNSSMASERTEVLQSMHLADYTFVTVVTFRSSENGLVLDP